MEAEESVLHQILAQHKKQVQSECLFTLLKLFENIITNPKEEKYRKIKRTNPAIQKKIFSLLLDIKLLQRQIDQQFLQFQGDNLSNLQNARILVKREIRNLGVSAKTKQPPMTEEQMKKAELLRAEQKKHREELLKKKQYMQSLAQQSKVDQYQKRTQYRPKVDSVARDIKFGASMHKFEFKEQKAPRG